MTTVSKLTKSQYKTFGPIPFKQQGYPDGCAIYATVRFDDQCGNGHNTFGVTGTIRAPGKRDPVACGCLHDEIAAAFPHLAPLIKWHLCSTDGPLHYLANTVYLAGDRDHNGHRAGDPCAWEEVVYFEGFPLGVRFGYKNWDFVKWLATADGADFEVIRIDRDTEKERDTFGPKFTLGGAPDRWHQCPFDTEREALEFVAAMSRGWKIVALPTATSKGKARQLESARRAAIWPDATDEELTAPGLADRLTARLPALLAEFRAAVESLGLTY